MSARILTVLLFALGAGACGDPEDAPAKCQELVDLTCTRAVECGTQNSQAECLTEAMKTSSCSRAKTVKPTFATCLDDVRKAACADLTTGGLPDSCDAVILF